MTPAEARARLAEWESWIGVQVEARADHAIAPSFISAVRALRSVVNEADALGADVHRLTAKPAKVLGIPSATLFTCRCCDRNVQGRVDGTVLERGWRTIARIDGPNAICPSCEADPNALDALRMDGYENAHIGPSMPVRP